MPGIDLGNAWADNVWESGVWADGVWAGQESSSGGVAGEQDASDRLIRTSGLFLRRVFLLVLALCL